VLVATDVAARGLDLPDLDLVIHADLPQNRDMLVHRSGRTGRAGRKGTSVLLVPVARRGFVERVLLGRDGRIAWSPAPTADQIVARDLARLDAEIEREIAELGERDRELGRPLAARVQPEDLAALVIRGRLAAAPAALPVTPVDEPPQRQPPRRELSRPEPARPRGRDRSPAPEAAAATQGYVMFRVNIGRHGNADPRWLIPLLCRRGEVDKRSIGKIRILERETHVEITAASAQGFGTAASRPDPRDRKIRITAL